MVALDEIAGPMVEAGVEPCRLVILARTDGVARIPYWRIVESGGEYSGVRVLYANPRTCVLAPGTQIYWRRYCEYREEELENNVVIWERCDGEQETPYAYPKRVYSEIRRLYLDPILRGERPFNIGLVLAGAPGTGKSKLAEIIARMLGFNVFRISPDTILSKWVGESEENTRKIIESAKNAEPSVVVIDDAEWILSTRSLASVHEHMSIMLNVQNILFDEMQRCYNEGRQVLFIATTNVKPTELDQAFLRHGRFGKPIFVPLPDYEALRVVLAWKLGDEKKAEELAFKAVNAGLSMADALGIAERIKAGIGEEIKTVGGRGYTRIHVERIKGFENIFKQGYLPEEALRGRSRLYIQMIDDVATAVAVQLAYTVKKTVIKVNDVRYIDEAVHSANMLGSVLVMSSTAPDAAIAYAYENTEGPIVFTGPKPPPLPAYPILNYDTLRRLKLTEETIRALLAYKRIKADDKLVKRAVNAVTDTSTFETLLHLISTLGTLTETLINQAKVIAIRSS